MSDARDAEGLKRDHRLARLVFETINSTNLPAVSDSFSLDSGWHHLAVTAEDARKLVTFYLDGAQTVRSSLDGWACVHGARLIYVSGQQGNDWYDPALFLSTNTSSLLALGGDRMQLNSTRFDGFPTRFELLAARVDEISLLQARLSIDRLGWFNPSLRYKVPAGIHVIGPWIASAHNTPPRGSPSASASPVILSAGGACPHVPRG